MGKVIDLHANRNYNLIINDLRFEWDTLKAFTNIRKHGVSFESATTAFSDEFGILIKDDAHAADEERFILLGCSEEYRLLVVCHCC
jgi:uncharacterized DUF497 family protein